MIRRNTITFVALALTVIELNFSAIGGLSAVDETAELPNGVRRAVRQLSKKELGALSHGAVPQVPFAIPAA